LNKGYDGWQFIFAPLLFFIGLLIFSFDYYFQISLKKYFLINFIELTALIVLLLFFYDFLKIFF